MLGLLPGAVLAAAPVAVADTATTAEDTLVTITVVATDTDGEGLAFSVGDGSDARRPVGLRDPGLHAG